MLGGLVSQLGERIIPCFDNRELHCVFSLHSE
jgi:hypothetical protein